MGPVPKTIAVISCVVLTFFMTLTGCQSMTGKTASQTMSDASISTAVQAKFTSDRPSNFPRIDVDTERGVVNLSGVVETEGQRTQAARLAQQVKGVVHVNNNLQLQGDPPSGKRSNSAQANEMKDSRSRRVGGTTDPDRAASIIQGEVVRVEGDHYFVKGRDGQEIRLHADTTTMRTERIKAGDRVEAKFDQNNHALSLLPAP